MQSRDHAVELSTPWAGAGGGDPHRCSDGGLRHDRIRGQPTEPGCRARCSAAGVLTVAKCIRGTRRATARLVPEHGGLDVGSRGNRYRHVGGSRCDADRLRAMGGLIAGAEQWRAVVVGTLVRADGLVDVAVRDAVGVLGWLDEPSDDGRGGARDVHGARPSWDGRACHSHEHGKPNDGRGHDGRTAHATPG